MPECPQCHGKKIIELFASIEPCTVCEGRGVIEDPQPPAPLSVDLAVTNSDFTVASHMVSFNCNNGITFSNWGGSGGVYLTAASGGSGGSSGNGGVIEIRGGGGVGNTVAILGRTNGSTDSAELLEWAVARMQDSDVLAGNDSTTTLDDPRWEGAQELDMQNFSVALAVLEHHGHVGAFFLISCRDFASLRMLPESSHVVWSNNRLFLFGLEVKRDRRVPLQYAAAVAHDRKLSLIRGL
jgi:hypothetical protein